MAGPEKFPGGRDGDEALRGVLPGASLLRTAAERAAPLPLPKTHIPVPEPTGEITPKTLEARSKFDKKYPAVVHLWSDTLSAKIRGAAFYVGKIYVNHERQVCRSSHENCHFLFAGIVKTESLDPELRKRIKNGGAYLDKHGNLPEYLAIFFEVDEEGMLQEQRIILPDL